MTLKSVRKAARMKSGLPASEMGVYQNSRISSILHEFLPCKLLIWGQGGRGDLVHVYKQPFNRSIGIVFWCNFKCICENEEGQKLYFGSVA